MAKIKCGGAGKSNVFWKAAGRFYDESPLLGWPMMTAYTWLQNVSCFKTKSALMSHLLAKKTYN